MESTHSAPAHETAIPLDAFVPDDPLTICLIQLTRYYQRPYTAQTLTTGLPLVGNQLSAALFSRAAARAGLNARLKRRSLDDLPELAFPVVLLLKDGQACVVVKKDNETWTILDTHAMGGEVELEQRKLAEMFTGFVIFVKPSFEFDPHYSRASIPRLQHWLWSSLKLCYPLYGHVLLGAFLINLFALALPLFSMNVYDRVVPNQTYETLWVLALGVGLLLVFDMVIKVLRAYYIDLAGKRIDIMLSAQIFEHVLGIKVPARAATVGSMVSHFQDFEGFRDFITSATMTVIVDIPFVILFLLVIYWLGGWLVLIPLTCIPIMVLMSLLLQRPLGELIRKSFQVSSLKQASLIESLSGIDTIKACAAESVAQHRWERIIGEFGHLSIKTRSLSSMIVTQAGFVQQFATIALVVAGVYLIGLHELTLGGLIACSLLLGRTLAPFAQVASLISRYHHAKAGLMGMQTLMEQPVERPAGHDFVNRANFRGEIEFRNVNFSYPGQDVLALDNVSFRIAPGERVAIIGRIGSGKSTLEKLILGFHAPNSGAVWVDGVDIRQIDPAQLRHNIGYVPEDVFLFDGSVKENIVLPAPYVDDAMMLDAAEIAGANEFVYRHPKGFDMRVGERGAALSGGQKQTIGIARALLLNPAIYLFDEVTSALDNRSEEQFKQRFARRLTNQHTLILITHRMSMLTLVDRVMVMDGGRMIADGPKEEVLALLSGGKLRAA
ncbi:type I secretion system permease/ATPase [Chitinibacter bivalviorum]|uniref:Cyclolysin secretion/processing ATP-binding protein CyaB n=1 Tax=Chitinibacter bivalviorum TaxID=2739434 RepID=A0A7H9BLT5_9NEIS|nr:type I secretion system permease/ATPase [Chitinibacter bivalviorum]QLG89637.1 type I secretion system permease/ATPase [Chitinibacter bivalviorum]